jgi:hypothetical protein
MNRHRIVLVALALALPGAAFAGPESPRVYSDAGNIYFERDGAKTQLTKSEQDIEPVLSPDGLLVVFTRQRNASSKNDDDQFCNTGSTSDELHQVGIDGNNDKILLHGHKGEGGQQLCGFTSKQFSSDGHNLYFLTPGWVTSGALHVFDMRKQKEQFLIPASDLVVLSFCKSKYKDYLVVLDHRYFLFGGSYDWYWLFDPTGKKEIGPVGDFENPADVVKQAHEDWCSP